MSVLDTAALRARVAALLTTTGDGWVVSGYPAELVPFDARETTDRSVAVSVTRTTFDSQVESSRTRRADVGGAVTSRVLVRWAWALRLDGAAADYDAALTAELALLHALLATPTEGLHLTAESLGRRIERVESEMYVVGDINLVARHRLPVTAPE